MDTPGLGDMKKIKNPDIFYQMPWYQYCDNIVVLTISV